MLNWILARGGQLVPAFAYGALSPGDTKTLHFTLYPNEYAYTRVWVVNARATGSTPFTVVVDGQTLTFGSERVGEPQMVRQAITTPSSSLEIMTLVLSCPSSSGAGFIDTLQCFEAPRAFLNTTEDAVTDPNLFTVGRPINTVIETLVENLAEAFIVRRRCGLFYWAVDTADAFSTGSTTYVPIFPLQPSANLPYGTTFTGNERFANVRVYARATGGGTGTFRVQTSQSGDTATRSIPATGAWTWVPSTTINTVSFDLQTEDIEAVDGLRSATRDEMTFSVKADAGGTTIQVAAISVGQWKQNS